MSIEEGKIYNAIILNEPYAGFVKQQIKTIETRMKKFKYTGDLVICCDKGKSTGYNAGKALCIVEFCEGRPMTKEDELAACIECVPGRVAYPLRNWRYFSLEFEFSKRRVSGPFQGIFQIKIPGFVKILNREQELNGSVATGGEQSSKP
jgi:hypothetical protein